MKQHAMFLDCPAWLDDDGTRRCGLPAVMESRYVVDSTGGPVECARISCPGGHRFNAPVEFLTLSEPARAIARLAGGAMRVSGRKGGLPRMAEAAARGRAGGASREPDPHGPAIQGEAMMGGGARGAVTRVASVVLLVEDEPKLRELVRLYLERAGYSVLSTDSGAEAITLASSAAPDLVVLDLGLPDVPGEVVARELLADRPIPVLMLTARSDEEDRIRGLELGADDYVTKPFSPRELVLRVQAILRRGGRAARAQGLSSYGGGALTIDEPRRIAMVRGVAADLTPTEWGILVALATVPGRVYSRLELINRVRGYEFEGYERTIDVHVKNLRRKIEEDSAEPRIIRTVLGGGYCLGLARDD